MSSLSKERSSQKTMKRCGLALRYARHWGSDEISSRWISTRMSAGESPSPPGERVGVRGWSREAPGCMRKATAPSPALRACLSPRGEAEPATSACAALTRLDLPMPRAPHSSALLAGRPPANRRVFSSSVAAVRSMPFRRPRGTRLTLGTGTKRPPSAIQTNARAASKSGATGAGRLRRSSATAMRSSKEASYWVVVMKRSKLLEMRV